MKRLLSHFILLLVPMFFQAQYWAPPNSEWHYTESKFWPFPILEDYIKISHETDTVVNGIICSKLIKRHKPVCWGRPYFELMYFENDKVYFWDEPFGKFQVLYDFGKEEGESWIIEVIDYNDIDTLIVFVDSTTFVSIEGIDKKKLYVTYNFVIEGIIPSGSYDTIVYSSEIIETIGDLQYMFNYVPQPMMVCDGNFSEGLRCYYDEVLGLYETGIAPYCTYVEYVGVDTDTDINNYISCVPNPFSGNFSINSHSQEAHGFRIIDGSGRRIMHGNLFTGKNNISIQQKGFLVVEVLGENGNIIERKKVYSY